MLAEALTTNDFDLKISDVASPKIAIRDDAVRRYTKNQKGSKLTKAEQEKQQWRKYYWSVAGHSTIIIYGALVLIFQFWKFG